MYKCQNICIKNQEPRHLFIKKLYFGHFGFFHTFKAYIYIYIYIHIYMGIMGIYVYVFYLKQCVCEVIPGGFRYLPGEEFNARSHPGRFFKM